MTDEQCGHETPNGPCKNPATEGDSCWIESHGGHVSGHGRDFVIDESDHDDIIAAAKKGLSKAGCARAAGTGIDQLTRYLDADEHSDFRERFMRARAQGEQRLVHGPLEQHEEDPVQMDAQHARFLLSTSFDYVKTEKKEITGEDGGPLETEVVIGGDEG